MWLYAWLSADYELPSIGFDLRRGLTIRYIPTRILSDGPFRSAFLLCGNAVPGVNQYNPWPQYMGGRQMPFADSAAWNQRAEVHNQRHHAAHLS